MAVRRGAVRPVASTYQLPTPTRNAKTEAALNFFGGAALSNAYAGRPVSGGDVADSALTVGLNLLPFGAGAAAKGAVKGLTTAQQTAAAGTKKLASQKMAINLPQRNLQDVITSGGEYIPQSAKRASVETEPLVYGFMMSDTAPPIARATRQVPAGNSALARARQQEAVRRSIADSIVRMGNPQSGAASAYFRGQPGATMVLKDSVKGRSTISPDDMSRTVTPANAPRISDEFANKALGSLYLESRTRGGINLANDVEKILVSGGPKDVDRVSKMLKDAGYNIPVGQIRSAFRNPTLAEKLLDSISFGASVAARATRNALTRSPKQKALQNRLDSLRIAEPEA